MAEKTDSIENILSNGIDLKNRRIYFGAAVESYDSEGSDFTWRSCEWAIRAIHIMEAEGPHKPIELHMSSPGGDPYEMLRLINVMEASTCQFKFFGGGKIMSAATWVMASADERYLYRHTRVLVHDSPSGGHYEGPQKLSDRYIDTDEERRLQDELNQMYADNSRMPKEFWDEFVKRDAYLSAEETIALGLADKIIEPKKRGNLRRMRIGLLNKDPDMKELNKLLKKLKDRTYQGKTMKIELHVPDEQKDKNIFVEPMTAAPSASPVAPVHADSSSSAGTPASPQSPESGSARIEDKPS